MPGIDIPASDARIQFVATAAQTDFNFDFALFSSADLVVKKNDVTLVLGVDYTVPSFDEDGGTVTLDVGADAGAVITIYRQTVIARESQYQNNGILDAAPLERDFDTITTILQEISRDVRRTFRLSDQSNASTMTVMPVANRAIMFNTAGTGLTTTTYNPDDVVNDAIVYATLASEKADESEAARLAAETARDEAVAAAASVDLPTLGAAHTVLKSNAAGTANEYAFVAALNVTYDNTDSGLTATNVKAAIDELASAAALTQLTGDLDVNGNAIISVSNGNIPITPNGSGKVILDGLSWPSADGTNGQALTTNGSGVLAFSTITAGLQPANNLSDVSSAATAFANIKQSATTSETGVVEKATSTEMANGTADRYPDAATVRNVVIGMNQTWQNPSRTHSTSYQNTTGKPIQVFVAFYTGSAKFQVSTNGSSWVDITNTTPSASFAQVTCVIPNNHYYRLNSSTTIDKWAELR